MADLVFPTPPVGAVTARAGLQHSLAWLRGQLSGGLGAAVEFLRLAHDSHFLLQLYREFFPRQWAASTAPLFAPARETPVYTAREVEFFGLVDDQITPLWLDWLLEGEEERCPYIPVRPLQDYDWFYDETDFADLPTGYQLALALNSCAPEVWINLCELHGYDPPAFPARAINWPRLGQLLQTAPPPLRHLQTAIELTLYETGNPLLDQHPESGGPDVEWSAPNLRRLQSWQRQALRLQRRVERLSAWLDGDEKREKLTYALRLWNLAGVEYDTRLAEKEAVSRAAEAEARRFARRMNPYVDQLQLFDAHP